MKRRPCRYDDAYPTPEQAREIEAERNVCAKTFCALGLTASLILMVCHMAGVGLF